MSTVTTVYEYYAHKCTPTLQNDTTATHTHRHMPVTMVPIANTPLGIRTAYMKYIIVQRMHAVCTHNDKGGENNKWDG